ncbi:hypothetical protein [Serinibacter salmoneus]|uniref:Holin n=1 Tax=Serinibacter salmoneus TaxID=556530 RepID=A0A2A9D0U8_9MICO|nr:hypothetical protein [Serinibacter salmoneus]PFG19885.1 hypothetical protein ATL40_1461 [Serinibacter salmoneus]
MHSILTTAWWVAAGQRAAYTALAALLPVAALLVAGQADPLEVLSLVAMSMVASLLTSLAGLPELGDRTPPLWLAALIRVVKTAAQVAVAAMGTAVLLTEVEWGTVGIQVAGAALTTLVRVLMEHLPETDPVLTVEVATDQIDV